MGLGGVIVKPLEYLADGVGLHGLELGALGAAEVDDPHAEPRLRPRRRGAA